MKKSLILGASFLVWGTTLFAQRKCGIVAIQNHIAATNPEFAAKLQERTANLQQEADNYYAQEKLANTSGKTTTVYSTIPVVFHIIVNATQLAQLGGAAGVAKRVDSQLAVLNRDYNRQNKDSTLIPSSWKPLYASSGIKFGPAHRDPAGHATYGYEIKTTTTTFVAGPTYDYGSAKHLSSGGLDAWDPTSYLNIWCIYFSDNPTLLGVATPYSLTAAGGGPIPYAQTGVCVSYDAFGKRVNTSDVYAGSGVYDLGRTLTHEVGHFFELHHTWGDDNGDCPWMSTGHDDGIADTPPESDQTFGNPTYTITGGTVYDACKMNGATLMQPIGIPCLDYMDYTDDKAMHMFTVGQVGVMKAQVFSTTAENFTLTQHPSLLNWPAEVSEVEGNSNLNIFPNPTDGQVNITFNEQGSPLNEVVVTNTIGQQIQKIDCSNVKNGNFSVDLSGMAKGIYFVTCNFASGSITRKILLQ
jgi:hypothetical protein